MLEAVVKQLDAADNRQQPPATVEPRAHDVADAPAVKVSSASGDRGPSVSDGSGDSDSSDVHVPAGVPVATLAGVSVRSAPSRRSQTGVSAAAPSSSVTDGVHNADETPVEVSVSVGVAVVRLYACGNVDTSRPVAAAAATAAPQAPLPVIASLASQGTHRRGVSWNDTGAGYQPPVQQQQHASAVAPVDPQAPRHANVPAVFEFCEFVLAGLEVQVRPVNCLYSGRV